MNLFFSVSSSAGCEFGWITRTFLHEDEQCERCMKTLLLYESNYKQTFSVTDRPDRCGPNQPRSAEGEGGTGGEKGCWEKNKATPQREWAREREKEKKDRKRGQTQRDTTVSRKDKTPALSLIHLRNLQRTGRPTGCMNRTGRPTNRTGATCIHYQHISTRFKRRII